jgi:putative FmdB family regulatory protein
MPLYDFLCRTCGYQFEALVRAHDGPECPECHGDDLERLQSAFVASTEEGRQKAADSSRQQQIRGRRDQLIAEAEYRKQHEH